MDTTILPGTSDRVAKKTRSKWNEKIRLQTERNIHDIGRREESINQRLKALEKEWDIDRMCETQFSTFSLLGITLGITVNKKWFIIPGLMGVFLFQHALFGWSPWVPLLRKWGIRTQREINEERIALKTLRGDFFHLHPKSSGLRTIIEAITKE